MRIRYVGYYIDPTNFLLGEVPQESIKYKTGITDAFLTKIIIGSGDDRFYSNERFPFIRGDYSQAKNIQGLWTIDYDEDVYDTLQEATQGFMKKAKKETIIKKIFRKKPL